VPTSTAASITKTKHPSTMTSTTTTSDASSPHLPPASPVRLTTTGGDDEARITSSPFIEQEGDATAAKPTVKATTAPVTTTIPAMAAPDSASDAVGESEEAGQARAGEGREGEEEVDLSDLMTLLFQHLRTDEGRAEFQALVEAEEVKAAAAEAAIGEKKGDEGGNEGSWEMTEGEGENGKPPVVK